MSKIAIAICPTFIIKTTFTDCSSFSRLRRRKPELAIGKLAYRFAQVVESASVRPRALDIAPGSGSALQIVPATDVVLFRRTITTLLSSPERTQAWSRFVRPLRHRQKNQRRFF
jgi:hypothetical protein